MIPHANTATRQGLQTLFIARSGEGNTLDIFVCMPATRMAELGKLRTNAGLRGAAEDGQEVYISGHKRGTACTTLLHQRKLLRDVLHTACGSWSVLIERYRLAT